VRDAVAIELSGKPSVTLSHDVFERAARAQARALGLPNLKLIIEPSPTGGNLTNDPSGIGEKVIEDVVDGLMERPSA
jgi:hypothetical protein